jgi:hypothetical protein
MNIVAWGEFPILAKLHWRRKLSHDSEAVVGMVVRSLRAMNRAEKGFKSEEQVSRGTINS